MAAPVPEIPPPLMGCHGSELSGSVEEPSSADSPALSCTLANRLSSGVGIAFKRSSVVASSLSFASVERGDDFDTAVADDSEDPLLDVCVNELLLAELLVAFWVLTMTEFPLLIYLGSMLTPYLKIGIRDNPSGILMPCCRQVHCG
jgi:hypothetical protein